MFIYHRRHSERQELNRMCYYRTCPSLIRAHGVHVFYNLKHIRQCGAHRPIRILPGWDINSANIY